MSLICHARCASCEANQQKNGFAWGRSRRCSTQFSLPDGWLSEIDAYQMEMSASLVTLSGHQTGENGVHRFEENKGLVRGLMYAGTPAVLTSLWTLDEGPTAEFMSGLYSALRGGASRSAAIRQAQLEAKSESRHPYHWAPFVLNGSW